jgi:predicted acylesterase/phospholipase RssA/CRP-like cAMP-binding protein
MGTVDKFLLLKMHPCTSGLNDEAIREIANEAELLRFESGDVVHRPNEIVTSLDFIVAGRLNISFIDKQGNLTAQRYQTAGGQYGILSAALGEPSGVKCVAEDPTSLLRIDFQVVLSLTKTHEIFRLNLLRMTADGIRQLLYKGKHLSKPHLVAIFHEKPETRELSRRVIQRLSDLGENPCVLTDDPEWIPIDGLRHHLMRRGERRTSEEEDRRHISKWSDLQRVIVDVDTSWEPAQAAALLTSCELVLWCVTPQNWRESIRQLEAFEAHAPTWREKVYIVWLLKDERTAPLATELQALAKRDIKISFSRPAPKQGPILYQGFERLIHLLRGIQIGVALGGGAARGMAHLGVLKAFEQHGIVIDMISGTSAGAMTGTLYSSGMGAEYAVERFVADLRPPWVFRLLPGGEQWYLFYKYRRGHFAPMLRKYLRQYRLEQLPIPMHPVSVDLVGGKVVLRDSGDAVDGIVESINLPGLSLPISRDGQALVDGGVINNVPADVLVEKGCNFVIAVSVTAKIESEFASNRPDTPSATMKRATTLQTLLRTYLVQNSNLNALGVQPADFVIEPDVTNFDLSAFSRTDELAAVGEQATLEAIPEIKEALARLDPQLFGSGEE